MWEYDELFAIGNILGIKNTSTGKIENSFVHNKNDKECLIEDFGVDTLDYPLANEQIWYVIKLDEHGNATTLFNREKDMIKPRPTLKTGMFVQVEWYSKSNNTFEYSPLVGLGIVITEQDRIYYQSGSFGVLSKIVENTKNINHDCFVITQIYDENTKGFENCNIEKNIIWKLPKYKEYLNSLKQTLKIKER